MCLLFRFGKYVLAPFLLEWLNLTDFVVLDTSLCNRNNRNNFHNLIAEFKEKFQNALFSEVYCRLSESAFYWVCSRGLDVTRLHLNKEGIETFLNSDSLLDILSRLSSVKIFASVSLGDSTVVCEFVAAMANSLEEIQCVSVDNSNLVVDALIQNCSNIRKCCITNDSDFDMEFLTHLCRNYSKLECLGIDCLSDPGIASLIAVNCRNLLTLECSRYLSHSHRAVDLLLLHCSSSLTKLPTAGWSNKNIRQYLYRCSHSITELHLDSPEDSLLLEISTLCPSLSRLTFGDSSSGHQKVTDVGLLAVVNTCYHSLKELSLGSVSHINNASINAIAEKCRRLTILSLKNNKLAGQNSLRKLSNIGVALKALDLTNMNVCGQLLIDILSGCSRLNELTLVGNEQLTDVSFEAAAPLMRCISVLHIQEIPNLTNETLFSLSRHCEDLSSINVGHRHSAIDDEGVLSLLLHCKIRTLSLSKCRLLTQQTLLNILTHCPKIALLFIHIDYSDISIAKRLVTDLSKLMILAVNYHHWSNELEQFIGEVKPSLCFYSF